MTIFSNHKLIPTVTIKSQAEADALKNILIHASHPIVELTLRSGFSVEAVNSLLNDSELTIGIGTLTDLSDLEGIDYKQADFFVSPGSDLSLIKQLNEVAPFVPGIETSSEIMLNKNAGISVMKFFPAELLGGTKKLQAYGDVYPEIMFLCTGGVNSTNYKSYLACKNVVAVGGSFVLPEKYMHECDIQGGSDYLLNLKS